MDSVWLRIVLWCLKVIQYLEEMNKIAWVYLSSRSCLLLTIYADRCRQYPFVQGLGFLFGKGTKNELCPKKKKVPVSQETLKRVE